MSQQRPHNDRRALDEIASLPNHINNSRPKSGIPRLSCLKKPTTLEKKPFNSPPRKASILKNGKSKTKEIIYQPVPEYIRREAALEEVAESKPHVRKNQVALVDMGNVQDLSLGLTRVKLEPMSYPSFDDKPDIATLSSQDVNDLNTKQCSQFTDQDDIKPVIPIEDEGMKEVKRMGDKDQEEPVPKRVKPKKGVSFAPSAHVLMFEPPPIRGPAGSYGMNPAVNTMMQDLWARNTHQGQEEEGREQEVKSGLDFDLDFSFDSTFVADSNDGLSEDEQADRLSVLK